MMMVVAAGVLLSLLASPSAPTEDSPACAARDCIERISRHVAIEAVAAEAGLAGTWESGGGLAGAFLYLFADRTYVYSRWADVQAETVYDKGTWQVAESIVILVPDADVTWSQPGDRRYLPYRLEAKGAVRLVGLDRTLGIFGSVAREPWARAPQVLVAASVARSKEWKAGESARRKREVMRCCWEPHYFTDAK